MKQNKLRQSHTLVWLLSPLFVEITSEWNAEFGIASLKRVSLEWDGSILKIDFSHSQGNTKALIKLLKEREEVFMKELKKHLHKYKLPRIQWALSGAEMDTMTLVWLIESLNAPKPSLDDSQDEDA